MTELYLIPNGPRPTTAAQAVITTGTGIHTLLQVKLAATGQMRAKIVEWGISFDGAAAGAGIKCELLSTKTVAASAFTAHGASGIINLDPNADAPTDDNPFALATNETGFSDLSVTEGTITDTRPFDFQLIQPTTQYIKQWPLGREPEFGDTEHVRIRVTAAVAVNAYCYVVVEV